MLRKGRRSDTRYCSKSCRNCASRVRTADPAPLPCDPKLRARITDNAPPGAVGYRVFVWHLFDGQRGRLYFPHTQRKTLRADGAMRKGLLFRLNPFEPPRVAVSSTYVVLYYNEAGAELAAPSAIGSGVYLSEQPGMMLQDGAPVLLNGTMRLETRRPVSLSVKDGALL